jgi:trehalose 6-phosphate phosphatase
MDVDEVLLTGLDRFGGVLEHLTDENASSPSPCNAWTARGVTGHVLTVLDSAAWTLRGESFDWGSTPDPTEVGGDDPHGTFKARAEAARAALATASLDEKVETPMGEMTIGQRLSFPAMDLHLHAWDLGRALGVDVELPPEIGDFVHAVLDPLPESMTRSDGVFGAPIEPPADATPTEVLMAWTGREVR